MLQYILEKGSTEEQIIAQCIRFNKPLPRGMENMPDLQAGLSFILSSFWSLCSCRNSGMGIGPIPWTAIWTFAKEHELRGDDAGDFVMLVQKLDSCYVKFHNDRIERERKSK